VEEEDEEGGREEHHITTREHWYTAYGWKHAGEASNSD